MKNGNTSIVQVFYLLKTTVNKRALQMLYIDAAFDKSFLRNKLAEIEEDVSKMFQNRKMFPKCCNKITSKSFLHMSHPPDALS